MWAEVDGRRIAFVPAGLNGEHRWVWATKVAEGDWEFSPNEVTEVGGKDGGEAQKNAKKKWPNIVFYSTPVNLLQMPG